MTKKMNGYLLIAEILLHKVLKMLFQMKYIKLNSGDKILKKIVKF